MESMFVQQKDQVCDKLWVPSTGDSLGDSRPRSLVPFQTPDLVCEGLWVQAMGDCLGYSTPRSLVSFQHQGQVCEAWLVREMEDCLGDSKTKKSVKGCCRDVLWVAEKGDELGDRKTERLVEGYFWHHHRCLYELSVETMGDYLNGALWLEPMS